MRDRIATWALMESWLHMLFNGYNFRSCYSMATILDHSNIVWYMKSGHHSKRQINFNKETTRPRYRQWLSVTYIETWAQVDTMHISCIIPLSWRKAWPWVCKWCHRPGPNTRCAMTTICSFTHFQPAASHADEGMIFSSLAQSIGDIIKQLDRAIYPTASPNLLFVSNLLLKSMDVWIVCRTHL